MAGQERFSIEELSGQGMDRQRLSTELVAFVGRHLGETASAREVMMNADLTRRYVGETRRLIASGGIEAADFAGTPCRQSLEAVLAGFESRLQMGFDGPLLAVHGLEAHRDQGWRAAAAQLQPERASHLGVSTLREMHSKKIAAITRISDERWTILKDHPDCLEYADTFAGLSEAKWQTMQQQGLSSVNIREIAALSDDAFALKSLSEWREADREVVRAISRLRSTPNRIEKIDLCLILAKELKGLFALTDHQFDALHAFGLLSNRLVLSRLDKIATLSDEQFDTMGAEALADPKNSDSLIESIGISQFPKNRLALEGTRLEELRAWDKRAHQAQRNNQFKGDVVQNSPVYALGLLSDRTIEILGGIDAILERFTETIDRRVMWISAFIAFAEAQFSENRLAEVVQAKPDLPYCLMLKSRWEQVGALEDHIWGACGLYLLETRSFPSTFAFGVDLRRLNDLPAGCLDGISDQRDAAERAFCIFGLNSNQRDALGAAKLRVLPINVIKGVIEKQISPDLLVSMKPTDISAMIQGGSEPFELVV